MVEFRDFFYYENLGIFFKYKYINIYLASLNLALNLVAIINLISKCLLVAREFLEDSCPES
jgi:hypothetical protein